MTPWGDFADEVENKPAILLLKDEAVLVGCDAGWEAGWDAGWDAGGGDAGGGDGEAVAVGPPKRLLVHPAPSRATESKTAIGR